MTRVGLDRETVVRAALDLLGLEPATALHTMIAIAHFVTGFVIEEQAAATRGPGGEPGTDHPLLTAAVVQGGPPESDRSFEHRLPIPDAEVMAASIQRGSDRFADLGMDADQCLIGVDDRVEAEIVAALELFGHVVNLVRRPAPQAAIAFNSGGHDSADAAARRLTPA